MERTILVPLRPQQLALAVALILVPLAASAEQPEVDPNRVWVVSQPGQRAFVKARVEDGLRTLKSSSSKSGLSAAAAAVAKRAKIHYEFDGLDAIVVTLPDDQIEALRKNKNVKLVERDVPRYPLAETVPYGIPRVQAPDAVAVGADGNGVKVCVIDSGIKSDHEDFAGISKSGYASSGQIWSEDNCGHGTHVAGTIAAVGNNDKGVIGVSPGKVSLYIVKYFDGPTCGFSYSSSLVNAATRCANAGAKVINMSLGGPLPSSAESTAFTNLYKQGVLSVAAAGNDESSAFSYPASYPDVMSVAALDQNNVWASFSQYNSAVDIAAPGVSVLSTYPKRGTPVVVNGVQYAANKIDGTASGVFSAQMVFGDRCESAGSWSNKVVLCERGVNTFADKVAKVKSGGGRAAIIYNNSAGNFSGSLGDNTTSTIPAVSVSQEDGMTLRGLLGQVATVSGATEYDRSEYSQLSGTSMATPHVAGVAALLFSAKPSATASQVRNAMTSTALDLGAAGRDNYYGYGLVQAFDALEALIGPVGTPGNKAPTANFTSVASGRTVQFTDASTDSDGTIASRLWNFGDGTTSALASPSKTYAADGTYNVSLTVTDDDGAIGTKTASVKIGDGGGGEVQTYANDADYMLIGKKTIESPISVSGRSGNGSATTKVAVDIFCSNSSPLKIDLLAPDGSVYNLHNRTSVSGCSLSLSKTYTFDLSAEALNGTWKLRIDDNNPDVGDSTLYGWSITF